MEKHKHTESQRMLHKQASNIQRAAALNTTACCCSCCTCCLQWQHCRMPLILLSAFAAAAAA
jgi:hypothetical protein